jgi:phage terminase large subunit-like protein
MKLSKDIINSVAHQYALDVKNNVIPTGKKIKLSVERYFQWLNESPESGFILDHKKGEFIIYFIENFINHIEGKLAGQPFLLAPFQKFTLYNLFGWVDSNGTRRIRTVYDKRAKKNGKTAEMAALALYCLTFDLEAKAQIYVGATKEDQAKLCWSTAKDMIESPVANIKLKKLGFKTLQKRIEFPKLNSFMSPLGGDSKTQDGINAHLSIIDEYHAHPTDAVKENLESSSVQRLQPITYHITTAGTNIASVCKNYEDSVLEVLNGIKKDDSLWIMIHDLDEDDDWENEVNWFKANPLLGQGLSIERIREEFVKAKNQPSKIPNFKTKHLNMWVDAPTIWISTEIWKKNKRVFDLEIFKKLGCFMAVDLSTTTDITAIALISNPDEKEARYLKTFSFCPEETIDKRSKEDRVPYRYWRDAGFLISTPGNVIDYAIIKEKVLELYFSLNCERVEIDRWNASQITSELLEKSVEMSEFSQTITSFSAPTKEFERLVLSEKLLHDGSPLLTWCLNGCLKIEDNNENVRISKSKSHATGKRIDPIIAGIMALGGAMSIEKPNEKDKYNNPNAIIEI